MNRRTQTLVFLGLFLLAFAGALFAQSEAGQATDPNGGGAAAGTIQGAQEDPSNNGDDLWDGDQDGRRGGLIRRILQRLDLSERQRQAIRSIIEAERPRAEQIRRRGLAIRRQLLRALQGGVPDPERLRRVATARGRLTARVTAERARVWSKIYEVLTPEQQRRADQILQRLIQRHPGGSEEEDEAEVEAELSS